MRELVEGHHVYIAAPPLYRVKIGNTERYIEKEAQFEELLVAERVKDISVTSRDGVAVNLTVARYGDFTRSLSAFEGFSARLRDDFGHAAGDFVVTHRLVETDAGTVDAAATAIAAMPANGYELVVSEGGGSELSVRVVETETGSAEQVRVPAELFASPVYAGLCGAYAKLVEKVGSPPFALAFGKKRATAETFPELRTRVLELAKDGLQMSRFKGLGEMDAEELWETTMNPAKRMLIQVRVEDAAAADGVFAKLMGDQVEPRREFIEQHAKDVRFLDV
jgi:DNA gyrase subunit B